MAELTEAHLVCCVYHRIFHPLSVETGLAQQRAITANIGITQQIIDDKVNEAINLATNDTYVEANYSSASLEDNNNLFRQMLASGNVAICMKPLYADNNESVKSPVLRQLVTTFNAAFDRALRHLIKDSSFVPWIIFASVWVGERPSKDVLRMGGAAHSINTPYVDGDHSTNITTSTLNPHPPPNIPIISVSTKLNIGDATNYTDWPQQEAQRSNGISALGSSDEPPLLQSRTQPVYENAIGNMERLADRQTIIDRLGQDNYDLLISICILHYDFDQEGIEKYIDDFFNLYCNLPGQLQHHNSVSFNAHHFDHLVNNVDGHGFEKLLRSRLPIPIYASDHIIWGKLGDEFTGMKIIRFFDNYRPLLVPEV